MLTSDLAMSWRRGRRTGPRALDSDDPELADAAGALVAIVADHVGRPRAELDRALDEYIGAGTDYRTIRGLVKLLMDRCVFETSSPVEPFALRREVFLRASKHHPVGHGGDARARVLAETAAALGIDPDGVERWLYADLSTNERLVGFESIEARELLERYNLAQAQALLYRCVRMVLRIDPQEPAGYRKLFDAIKAFRLIYSMRGSADSGYELTLDGPVSIFHRSQKYGVQMAVFLPALLECRGWKMRAEVDVKPYGTAEYELDSATTRLRAPDRESERARHPAVEKILTGLLQSKGSWHAEPCGEVVDIGETALVPDAVARHEDGTDVYLEVLGFWTPKYLAGRLGELRRMPGLRYLLLASSELFASRDDLEPEDPNLVVFKATVDLKSLRLALERFRTPAPAGPA